MLLFANKLGVHWYFWLAVNTVDNRDILSNYITFKEMFPSIFKSLIISPDESRGYIGFRSVAPPPPP